VGIVVGNIIVVDVLLGTVVNSLILVVVFGIVWRTEEVVSWIDVVAGIEELDSGIVEVVSS